MKKRSFLAAFAMVAGAFHVPTFAAGYPDKPVRLIIPFDAGGPTDVLVRLIMPALTEDLGQAVVVENRAGANSIIGMAEGARAAADGYTYVVGGSAYAINASFAPKLPYNTLRDFAAVAPLAVTPYFLVVRGNLPVQSVGDLVKLAKDKPGTLNYASSGTGSSPHLAGALMAEKTRTEIAHIPYKGTAPAINDMLGGSVDMLFTGLPAVQQHLGNGRLKVLAVAADKRVPFAENIPTMGESGLKNFTADAWFGVLAPAGVPEERKQRFARAIQAALKKPEVISRFAALGAVPYSASSADFQDFIRADVLRWAKFVKDHPDAIAER